MEAPDRAPAERTDVFNLMELLESNPGVFVNNLLPALEPRHKAALALTNRALRDAVQHSATQLSLRTGSCCLSREHQLGAHFPSIRNVVLKPGNLHEAMFVMPLFLMQAARHMTCLTSLELLDLLPDRPNEEGQCGQCSAYTSTYDLSAILATAAHCLPHLVSLDFTTHYISDAECAAIALITGLTRLQLRSHHGTHLGGLSRCSTLTSLAHLSITDREHSSRYNHHDLCMMLGATRLTSLALGPHSLAAPLIGCLAEMHSPDWQAGLAAPNPNSADTAAAVTAATALAATVAAAGSAAGGAGAGVQRDSASSGKRSAASPERQLPSPPPLASLNLAMYPMQFEHSADGLGSLTGLTRLYLKLVPDMISHSIPAAPDPRLPVTVLQQLSKLTRLQELGLGWAPQPQVLAALADNSSLKSLHLGGLFSAQPDVPPVGQLRLPHIKRLTAHMETPINVLRAAVDPSDPEPLTHSSCVSALSAFPALTRLELTGRIYGPALAHLPEVLPREGLRELLLPQRMSASSAELGRLKQLRGLTHLRLGWRSVHHAGPSGYTPVSWHHPLGLLQAQHAIENPSPSLRVFGIHSRENRADGVSVVTTSDNDNPLRHANPHAAAQAALANCATCGAPSSRGCFCRLRRVEVVGPLPPRELQHLVSLPSLQHVTLRDNPSWAANRQQYGPDALTPYCTLLELFRCEGVDGGWLDGCMAHPPPIARRLHHPTWCRVVVEPSSGVTAAELGRGYQYMGLQLLPWEELGMRPENVPRGQPRSSEFLVPEQAQVLQQQQQQQLGLMPPWLAALQAMPPGVMPPAPPVQPLLAGVQHHPWPPPWHGMPMPWQGPPPVFGAVRPPGPPAVPPQVLAHAQNLQAQLQAHLGGPGQQQQQQGGPGPGGPGQGVHVVHLPGGGVVVHGGVGGNQVIQVQGVGNHLYQQLLGAAVGGAAAGGGAGGQGGGVLGWQMHHQQQLVQHLLGLAGAAHAAAAGGGGAGGNGGQGGAGGGGPQQQAAPPPMFGGGAQAVQGGQAQADIIDLVDDDDNDDDDDDDDVY